ncbi:MAG TPA: delta-60 repeat domain-containing protein, partial [Flavisolibacter sp.]|nr:delta-60 repeat domain-containing protein [Flavisolibacter sp.]
MRKFLLTAIKVVSLLSCFSQMPGSLDPTFGNAGVSATAPRGMSTHKMMIQPDGKLIVLGTVPHPERYLDAAVARYTASGAVDRSFSGDGIFIEDALNVGIFEADIALQSDGKLLLAGLKGAAGDVTNLIVYRYNQDGSRDHSLTFEELA